VITIVNVVAKVELPRLPNFLLTTEGGHLPVEALDDESLRSLGQMWACALMEHARARRKAGGGS